MSQQENKAIILAFQKTLEQTSPARLEHDLKNFVSDDYQWHAVYPFEYCQGIQEVADTFYRPLLASFKYLQRRQDILIAGTSVFGGDWLSSMGHFVGMFEHPWLDIPATGRMTFLRYCEFHRIEAGLIQETYLMIDIMGVMHQAGISPIALQTGAEFIIPGPRTHDGIVLTEQDPAESAKTLELIQRMARDLGNHKEVDMDAKVLAETWHENMIWYGPTGIGSTMSIQGFKEQHQKPFRKALYSHRVHNGHVSRFAEGHYGGWIGWPSLKLKVTGGGYLGMPASNCEIDMRVVDMYRREGSKIAENWVFIDHPYVLKQQGLDIFERMKEIAKP